jgi:hypothetical protein
MKIDGSTVVSPMYGDLNITNRMVMSVITQFISKKNPFKIHLVLVDDYLEKRGDNDESYYDYYLSDEFSKLYDTEKIKISIIKNEKHKYQGESREIGYMAGDYPYFVLLDCDDMLAPNCCDKYISILRSENNKEGSKPLSCIQGLLYGFDTNGYTQLVNGDSIWVQSRCYNRNFLVKNNIHFPTGTNSRCGEDYPFMRKLDYAINHDQNFNCVNINFDKHDQHCQCTAYWFPNDNSLSRRDPHYGQHLSGWTMQSSNSILDFFEEYNELNGFDDNEDEYLKQEFLNMNIYAFYNILDFIKEVSSAGYIPIKEDWYALRDNVSKLRNRLKEKYWDEIIYTNVENMLFNVWNYSDAKKTESWIGTFFDWMNADKIDILEMDYHEMMEYAYSLMFDAAEHEIHSKQVQAWIKRHDISFDDVIKEAENYKKKKIELIRERFNGILNIQELDNEDIYELDNEENIENQ